MKKLLIYISTISLLISNEIITPIPDKDNTLNLQKVQLGKKLFFDTRLSKNNTISCSSCHDIQNGGDDGKKVAVGINNSKGFFNTPTILNSRYNFSQFWDGRVETLEKQVLGPIHNPVEMNSDFSQIVSKLSKDKKLKKEFKHIYNSDINKTNIIDAIVEFEKSLTTPNSKFDKYLKGELTLTKSEEKGYELFKDLGCISCHNGINIGGNLYQKVGVVSQFFPNNEIHYGRYNLEKKEDEKFYFKVPTLRNIELTAPYLHDGSVNTLSAVIEVMLRYQIGAIYTRDDIKNIESFLKTLTGEIPKIN
jgi:cytochrome c peroxidase